MKASAVGEDRPTIALVGTPNSGKTTLFNALTGLRQKVANYPGVTVEKKAGYLVPARDGSAETEKSKGGADGRALTLLDLPGLYGISAHTPEEIVSRDILMGEGRYAARPSAVLIVLDGSALERSLALLASVLPLGLPTAAVLTMFDEIKARGGRLDVRALSEEAGVPVVPVIGHRGIGIEEARELAVGWKNWAAPRVPEIEDDPAARYSWAAGIVNRAMKARPLEDGMTLRIDRCVLHPIAGPLIFLGVMAIFFQSIFSWAQPAMNALTWCAAAAGQWAGSWLPEGLARALVVNGLFKGVGSVVAFLPQILILFFLLFLLEDIGYMARAAFLMDRVMGWAGMQGRSFVALLSSYACAVPGIMATRGIPSPQDRLTTILVAPFMTCSARLPVYTLLIGAFIPDRPVLGPLRSQGLALLSLYAIGSLSAFLAAWLLRAHVLKGDVTPFYIELPPYRFPTLKSVVLAMLDRGRLFLRRAGTMILGASMLLCFLLNFPRAPQGSSASRQMEHSIAGRLGKVLEPVFRPVGFDWRVNVGILGSLAAREVVVSTLAQIYAVDAGDSASLGQALRRGRDPATGAPLMSTATALSLLAFFVYALQCMSTLAVMRRETNTWRWPAFAFGYAFACAWAASFVAYRAALAFGL